MTDGEPQQAPPDDDELVQTSSPPERTSRCARLWHWSPIKYDLHPCTGGLSCKGDCCPDEPPGAGREPDLMAVDYREVLHRGYPEAGR